MGLSHAHCSRFLRIGCFGFLPETPDVNHFFVLGNAHVTIKRMGSAENDDISAGNRNVERNKILRGDIRVGA
jgi:hypothetical protein